MASTALLCFSDQTSLNILICRRPGELYQGPGPVHPPPVDHVSGVCRSPPRHLQLLLKLPHLLQRQPTVQGLSLQTLHISPPGSSD